MTTNTFVTGDMVISLNRHATLGTPIKGGNPLCNCTCVCRVTDNEFGHIAICSNNGKQLMEKEKIGKRLIRLQTSNQLTATTCKPQAAILRPI